MSTKRRQSHPKEAPTSKSRFVLIHGKRRDPEWLAPITPRVRDWESLRQEGAREVMDAAIMFIVRDRGPAIKVSSWVRDALEGDPTHLPIRIRKFANREYPWSDFSDYVGPTKGGASIRTYGDFIAKIVPKGTQFWDDGKPGDPREFRSRPTFLFEPHLRCAVLAFPAQHPRRNYLP